MTYRDFDYSERNPARKEIRELNFEVLDAEGIGWGNADGGGELEDNAGGYNICPNCGRQRNFDHKQTIYCNEKCRDAFHPQVTCLCGKRFEVKVNTSKVCKICGATVTVMRGADGKNIFNKVKA